MIFYFWSWQFGYMIFASSLVTIDVYFFAKSRVFFNKAKFRYSGLRKSAFWMGLLAFVIFKSKPTITGNGQSVSLSAVLVIVLYSMVFVLQQTHSS